MAMVALASARSATIFRALHRPAWHERDSVQAQRDDVAHRGGGEDRQAQGPCHLLTRAGQGRGLRHGVVPDQCHGASEGGRTRDVGVADCIGRPVETRILPVPKAHDTIDAASRQLAGQLRPADRRGGQLLVQSGRKDDVRLGQQLVRTLELLVEPAQGGPFVAADEERRGQIPGTVEIPLSQEEADQRFNAREQHRAFRGLVAVTDAYGTHLLSVLFVGSASRGWPWPRGAVPPRLRPPLDCSRPRPHALPRRSKCAHRQSTRRPGGMVEVAVFSQHDATEAPKMAS